MRGQQEEGGVELSRRGEVVRLTANLATHPITDRPRLRLETVGRVEGTDADAPRHLHAAGAEAEDEETISGEDPEVSAKKEGADMMTGDAHIVVVAVAVDKE